MCETTQREPSTERFMNVVAFNADRRKTLRRAWLGAATAASLGGAAVGAGAATPAYAAETAGPASFADIVDRVKGAVVSVKVKLADVADDESEGGAPHRSGPVERFFKRFGLPLPDQDERRLGPPPERETAQGSGFFISNDGYIVTNNHVVEHASAVTVTTDGGKTLTAKVIGVDPKTDLALLKAEGANFPSVRFAAKPPRVGDWVIAVGNPFGLGGTVTAGIVSARGRDIGSGPYEDFIQIDAPVNHGNSGGPTFNNEGEVVGVNTAIFSPSGGSVGIGFAIAADVVQDVVEQLKAHGSVARGWLGVEIQSVTPDLADSLGVKPDTGALVAKESSDSPAAIAGVKVGDVIASVDGAAVSSPRDLARRIAALGPKKSVSLKLSRDGHEQEITVRLGVMPADSALAEATPAPAPTSAPASDLAKLGLKLEPGDDGVKIGAVDADSPAAERGLSAGDVIVEAGGKAVSKPTDVAAAFEDAKNAGRKSVLMRVKTDQSVRFVALPVRKAS
jgi:serine protease Do